MRSSCHSRAILPALLLLAGCTPSASSARAPAPSPAKVVTARPAEVSKTDRQGEAERLRALGLDVRGVGPVLRSPFSPPWSRRSFVVPASWFLEGRRRLKAKEPVVASALLQDLDALEIVMRHAYAGWDTAKARGFAWERWFAAWRTGLAGHGDAKLDVAEAFAPMRELIGFQLDNHTNIPLLLRLGSRSQSALLAGAASGPCDRARYAETAETPLATDDQAQQPKKAFRFVDGRFEAVHYIVYPLSRGTLQAVRCGGRWLKAKPVWSERAPTKELALTDEDVPAFRRLSPDAVLVRLPLFSKQNGERLRKLLPTWPKRGTERAVIIDLRDNGGGDAAFAPLLPWLNLERVKASLWSRRRLASSCFYPALRWGYATVSSIQLKPPISDGMRQGLQHGLDALFEPEATCERGFAEKPESAPVLERNFDPTAPPPELRFIALVNQGCGSDCEFMLRVLATMPETVIVGTNTYGVAQFIQPGYGVLPKTRLPFRIALGSADQMGDGRSFDGYGFDVDILLTRHQDHSPDAVMALVERLVKKTP